MNRKLLGDSHPEVARTMGNLAIVLYQKGDHRSASRSCEESLIMSERELGSEHPDVAATISDLAYLLTGEGAYREAERFVDESLAIRRKVLGDEDPKVGSALYVKANLLVAMRRYEEAGRTAAEAGRILELNLPADDWQVAMAKNLEGAALPGCVTTPTPSDCCSTARKGCPGPPCLVSRRLDGAGWPTCTSPWANRSRRANTETTKRG